MSTAPKRQLTQAAQVAKTIKRAIVAMGYPCRAKSDNFSMGDSVDIYVQDLPPAIFKELEERFEPHEYGTFDGMTDCQGFKNRDFDGAQTKYLNLHNEISPEVKQAAWDHIRAEFGHMEAPALYEDAQSYRIWNNYAPEVIYRALRADVDSNEGLPQSFWDTHGAKPAGAKRAPSAATIGEYAIEMHTHTKFGFDMFIVVSGNCVDSATFSAQRERAQSMGGWYSRAWGSSPSGFAFKELETAQAFAGGTPSDPDPKDSKPDHSAKLRALADGLTPQIEAKFSSRLENTAKRVAEGARARLEGSRLQRTQQALYALAALHEAGTVPAELADLISKNKVYNLMGAKLQMAADGYHQFHTETGEPSGTDSKTLALWALLSAKSEEDKRAEELSQKVTALQFASIAGYFPTPAAVVDRMLDAAQIEASHTVGEFSAGSGNIADRVSVPDGRLVLVEVNPTLCAILRLKGYEVEQEDFMQWAPERFFDRILLNPPFENLQDADHVRRAFGMLAPLGGRLVAIMSPSAFYRSDRKSTEFREWFESVGGEKETLPDGSFKASGTNVATVLVTIDN